MPNTDLRLAAGNVERILQIMHKFPIKAEDEQKEVSVACGVANLPEHGTDLRTLLLGAKAAKNRALATNQSIVLASAELIDLDSSVGSMQARNEGFVQQTGIEVRDLLLRAELISLDYLENAFELTKRMPWPLSRVLSMEGRIKESTVEAIERLAAITKDGTITSDDAIRAAQLIGKHDLDLETAIKRLGIAEQKPRATPFSDLLLSSGLAKPRQINHGLKKMHSTGLPLGCLLLKFGFISEFSLHNALALERLVKEDLLSRADAVKVLRDMHETGASLPQCLESFKVVLPASDPTTLGRLLVHNELLTEADFLVACEKELTESKGFADVLLECGFAKQDSIDEAKALLANNP